jgi:hypothetical protein
MKSPLKLFLALAVGLASFSTAANPSEPHKGTAAKGVVQAFNEGTWASLLKTGPRPAAYMFTTSYCSACPAVFQEVRDATKNSKLRPELIVVLMDVEGNNALRHAAHFKGMTQLFSFDGYEPAIRSTIDPTWRNITPFVVLIDRQGAIQKSVGSPSPQSLQRWLR